VKGAGHGLVADSQGNLYGVTGAGGPGNNGLVFELAAGTHTFSILSTLNVTNGVVVYGGDLVIDGSGNLYGIAGHVPVPPGQPDFGGVFKVDAQIHKVSVIATFNGLNRKYPRQTRRC
jgi:uncharacterized repeat protein (TIGR03803 family)